MSKEEQDKAFWKAYLALEQTINALNEAIKGTASEKAKPPKGRAVALSTTCP